MHMKLAIFWRGYEFLLTKFSVDHRATTVGAIGGPSDILVASGHRATLISSPDTALQKRNFNGKTPTQVVRLIFECL